MSTRPRLTRSIPFWGLLAVSLGAAFAGGAVLTTTLGSMNAGFAAGSATAADVYVGQVVAVAAAIVLAAGIVGIFLTLAVAALATLRPHAPAENTETVGDVIEIETVDEAAPVDGTDVTSEAGTSADDAASEDADPADTAHADTVPADTEVPAAAR